MTIKTPLQRTTTKEGFFFPGGTEGDHQHQGVETDHTDHKECGDPFGIQPGINTKETLDNMGATWMEPKRDQTCRRESEQWETIGKSMGREERPHLQTPTMGKRKRTRGRGGIK